MRWFLLLSLLASPATADPWIDYGYSGGFAGVIVKLTISSGGEVEYKADRDNVLKKTLSQAEVEKLRAALPATLPPALEPEPGVYDGINHHLTVDGKTARWGTGQPFPESLGDIVDQLQQIENDLTQSTEG